MLAYGQTGSGKTHTMGASNDYSEKDDIGVIPSAVADIFSTIKNKPDYGFTVKCAFMELYQDKLYDLLSTRPRDQSIVEVREEKITKLRFRT